MLYSRVCGHDLWVDDFNAEWDAIHGDSDWEKERIDSIISFMGKLGTAGVLWDIGTEHGWMIGLIVKATACRTVLVEPTPEFWPNIKNVFQFNGLGLPIACVQGFVGREHDLGQHPLASAFYFHGWPPSAVGPEAYERSYLHPKYPRGGTITPPTFTLDEILRVTGREPDGVTIDVEGAEYDVLLGGAEGLLEDVRPRLWVSIHPDLMERDFGTTPDDVFDLMLDLGYKARHLRTDHEEHWEFTPS